MTEETLMTDPTATTTEGDPASQQTLDPSATGAPEEGQQPTETHSNTDGTTKGEGQGEAEGTKTDDPKKSEGAPEAYEFAFEEGKEIDEAIVNHFADAARELNLPQDAAQKMLDKMAPVMAERQAEQIAAVQEQWAEESRADKEFGGERLTENLGLAKKAMDEFATPELRTLLNESGMGNHPEVIRMFVRVGKTISEDSFVTGGQGVAQQTDPKRLYPNSNMN